MLGRNDKYTLGDKGLLGSAAAVFLGFRVQL